MKKLFRITALIMALVFTVCALGVNAAVTESNASADLSKNFQQFNIKIVANKITAWGIAGAAEKANVTFYLIEGSHIAYAKQISTAADGTFEAAFSLDPARYDAANPGTLLVGCSNANTKQVTGIELYSQAELDACVAAFKTINSGTAVGSFLNTYKDMLAVNATYNPDELELLYKKYQTGSYGSIANCDEVISAIDGMIVFVNDYRAFMTAINTAATNRDGGEVKNLITNTYKHIIPFDTTLTLIQNETALFGKMVAAYTTPYTSFEDIENAFVAAKVAQRDEEAVNGYVASTSGRTKKFIDEEWKIAVNANLITISGQTEDAGEHNLVFTVSDYNVASPNILGLYQMKTEKDGTFAASFTVDENLYGAENKGVVQVGGKDRKAYQFVIDLYSKVALDDMRADFKAINSYAAMQQFLFDHNVTMGIGAGYSEGKAKLLYEIYGENDYSALTESDETIASIIAIDTAMYEVKTFVDGMNTYSAGKLWGYIQNAIEVENDALAEKSLTFAELRNKAIANTGVSKKGIYMRMIDQSFECVRDIINAYDVAYTDQMQFEANNDVNDTPIPLPPSDAGGGDGGSGGAGGGGGGGGSTPSTDIGIAPELIPDDSAVELDENKKPVAEFKDLAGYNWAKTAIDGLRNLSIVRGDGDGSFRPGDTVTREEFLSMLLKTFYIEPKSGDAPFSDVKSGEWYTDVVSTAYELGITNGIGDGSFGIGQKIVRADMVVMASRLAAKKQFVIEKSNEVKVFADFSDIPEYAYNDVVAFQQAGLVNGDDAGHFNPVNQLTRAEAAVFFWNIFQYIESQI